MTLAFSNPWCQATLYNRLRWRTLRKDTNQFGASTRKHETESWEPVFVVHFEFFCEGIVGRVTIGAHSRRRSREYAANAARPRNRVLVDQLQRVWMSTSS